MGLVLAGAATLWLLFSTRILGTRKLNPEHCIQMASAATTVQRKLHVCVKGYVFVNFKGSCRKFSSRSLLMNVVLDIKTYWLIPG